MDHITDIQTEQVGIYHTLHKECSPLYCDPQKRIHGIVIFTPEDANADAVRYLLARNGVLVTFIKPLGEGTLRDFQDQINFYTILDAAVHTKGWFVVVNNVPLIDQEHFIVERTVEHARF